MANAFNWLKFTIVGLSVLFGAEAASAAVYDVTFTGNVFDLSVVLTTDDLSNSIVTASGSVTNLTTSDTTTVLGVAPIGVSSLFGPDNEFGGASPYVSSSGILFESSNVNFLYNLYFDGANYFVSTTDPTGDISSPFYNPGDEGGLSVTSAISSVPELSTWFMLLIGFSLIGFLSGSVKRTERSDSAFSM